MYPERNSKNGSKDHKNKKSMLERFAETVEETCDYKVYIVIILILLGVVVFLGLKYKECKPLLDAAAAAKKSVAGVTTDASGAMKYFTSSTSPGFDLTYTPNL